MAMLIFGIEYPRSNEIDFAQILFDILKESIFTKAKWLNDEYLTYLQSKKALGSEGNLTETHFVTTADDFLLQVKLLGEYTGIYLKKQINKFKVMRQILIGEVIEDFSFELKPSVGYTIVKN